LVAPKEDEAVVDKRHSSAFQDTTLHERLQRSEIDTLVIAGMQTEYCVDSARRAAAANGYRVVLASDGHTTSLRSVAAQIIADHNLTLDGFGELAATDEIRF
jgi:nicotinamidase-related amidase